MKATDPRLDRRVEFDEASRKYPIRALLTTSEPRSYTWSLICNLDQGNEGACVGFSITHEMIARPVRCVGDESLAKLIYYRARQLDEWPGERYSGTSVLAGMKAATEVGYYSEYRWAFGLMDLLAAVSRHGPAVLGINWYESMRHPDEKGRITVAGRIVGGHAILCNAVSVPRQEVRLENSWGEDWGDTGGCWISWADMDRLLQEDGEACIPISRQKVVPT